MGGFNYGGGPGDGTGWSSERGNEPDPGGGHQGHGGDHDHDSGGGKGGTSGNWAGAGPVNVALINSAISEAIKNALPRNTTEAISTPAYRAMRAAFDALPVDKQPAARDQINQAWQRAHDAMPDKVRTEHETGGRNGHTVVGTAPNQTKVKLAKIIPLVTGDINQALGQHQAAQAEADQKEALTKTSEIVSDVGEKVSKQLGQKYNEVAQAIANDMSNFQGKTIRNINDAMASLNKITSNPNLKINQADRDSIVNAFKSVSAQGTADKLGNLARAFKVADLAQKVEKVREKSIAGYQTGNWQPLMLEVESWVISGVAASITLAIFSSTLGSILLGAGVPALAIGIMGILLAALIASLIDDKIVDKLNNEVIRPAY